MANIYCYDLDFNFKSKEDLEKGLELLKEFFTYDYIGENRYTVNGLNLTMEVSYNTREPECGFERYLINDSFETLYRVGRQVGYTLFDNSFTDDYEIKYGYLKKDITGVSNTITKSLDFRMILGLCDSFRMGFYDYNEDETKNYTNVITEKNI